MVGRDSTDWLPTAFRTHTLGDIAISGSNLVGQEVTVAGHAEISRGRGGVCFLTLRDGTGRLQVFLKKDALDEEI
ncbi:MAG: OB-fold nucleic acid binding domain-containing protein, partial [Candidatus Thermoplasmatota archaeon]|nr:OB-fold nucleic acid binding domain-containing protein [Candidatus Thermoplasmatota archaeon]